MKQRTDSGFYIFCTRMVVGLLVLCVSGTVASSQQDSDKSASSTQQAPDVKPAVLVLPSTPDNVALLGTDQRYLDLGTLQARRRTFFMYGMGFAESYINDFRENSPSQDNNQSIWSPHIAVINASDNSSFSIQYAPTLTQSVSGPSSRTVFHSGIITLGEPIAPNWLLQLSSTNTYGTDFARLISPPAFKVINGVPVSDPSSASFQFNRGKVFSTADSAGLTWQRSPSQVLHFSVQDSYFTELDSSGPSSMATSAEASYSFATSPRTAFSVGGNFYHQVFSVGGCDGYGFTIGATHQFGRYISLALQAGPEFENAPCNKTLAGNYGISLSYPLSRRSRLGLTASRSYLTNYLANTQYSDIGALTYSRQLSEAVQITFNSGYARSVRSQAGLPAYVGYFAGSDLSWKLSRSFSLGAEFRRFDQVSGGPMEGQNVALVSLGWNPLPIRLVK